MAESDVLNLPLIKSHRPPAMEVPVTDVVGHASEIRQRHLQEQKCILVSVREIQCNQKAG
jgi:hypothetical protein